MPLYACWCRDVPRSAAARAEHLHAHLAHVEAHLERYAVAGPLKDGEATVGSLLVIEAESAADARAFLAADPYAAVWEHVEVAEFRAVAGKWVGGAAWKK